MKISEKVISLKNSAIDFILRHLESVPKLPSAEHDSYNYGGHVELSLLSPEERKKAFIEFAEGNEGLYTLLTTAYEHGIESMFCCSGHGNNLGYVVFKVTDDNLSQLQQLGKVLSHDGISTDFEHHHRLGFRVSFFPFKAKDSSWFAKAAETIENPPVEEIVPTIYYHETPTYSYEPLSHKIKKGVISTLKKWRGDEPFSHSSEEITSPAATSKNQTFSKRLRDEFPTQDLKPQAKSIEEPSEKLDTITETDISHSIE